MSVSGLVVPGVGCHRREEEEVEAESYDRPTRHCGLWRWITHAQTHTRRFLYIVTDIKHSLTPNLNLILTLTLKPHHSSPLNLWPIKNSSKQLYQTNICPQKHTHTHTDKSHTLTFVSAARWKICVEILSNHRLMSLSGYVTCVQRHIV